jgi:cysteinyl-tRNA synthetase
MSWRHLGEQIDIHGGGRDLIFPHHENEIAQSEAFHDRAPFARYWMHNGLLLVDDEKMSKSLGNFITTRDLLDHGEGEEFRYFVVTSHYRKPLNFTRADFEAASRGLERLRAAAHAAVLVSDAPNAAAGVELATEVDVCTNRFIEAMDSDFNTPDALAALHDLVRAINRARDAAAPVQAIETAQARLRELAGVLGLTLAEPAAAATDSLVDPLVNLLIEVRADLRTAKQWALADTIRDRLAELGVALEDGPTGTTYRLKERE